MLYHYFKQINKRSFNDNINMVADLYLKTSLLCSAGIFSTSITYGTYYSYKIQKQRHLSYCENKTSFYILIYRSSALFKNVIISVPKSIIYGFSFPIVGLSLYMDYKQNNLFNGIKNIIIPYYTSDHIQKYEHHIKK